MLSDEQIDLIRSVTILSTKEVADRAGLAESSIRTYRSRGKLPPPDVTIGDTPGWLASTIDPWIAKLPGRKNLADPRPGRHAIGRPGGSPAYTDNPVTAEQMMRNLTGRGIDVDYTFTADVTCLHATGSWDQSWQWWSDHAITRGSWHGEQPRTLRCEQALTLAATANNRAGLPADLPGILASAISITTTLREQQEHTRGGWTTETVLRHHHIRYETSPAADGTFAETGVDLWTVDVQAGGLFGGEGEDHERRLLFVDETEARAAYDKACR